MRFLANMKNFFILILLPFFNFFFVPVSGQSDSAFYYSEKILLPDLKSDLAFLASPRLEGRGTPGTGLEMAGDFIKEKFQGAGLKPFFRDYKQIFYQEMDTLLPVLEIGRHKYSFGKDYYTSFPKTRNKISSNNIVFANANGKDWPGTLKDMRNKILVLLPGLTNGDDSSEQKVSAGIIRAHQLGARAVLLPSCQFFAGKDKKEIDQLKDQFDNPDINSIGLPVICVSRAVILNLVGKNNFDSLMQTFEKSNLIRFAGIAISFRLKYRKAKVLKPVFNVAGFIPGKDTSRYLVIGAHYDHLGRVGDRIYYGADDNASGTATLIQLARVFSEANRNGHIPQMNVLFVAFTAEEKGLAGSDYFVSKFSSKNRIEAMINMDMIGRSDNNHRSAKDYVFVIGRDYNPGFWMSTLTDVENELPGFYADYSINAENDPELLMQRSDQYPFFQQEIPVLFFFDDMKKDYHLPSDTVEKINWDLLKKRAQFIFLTAYKISHKEVR